MDSTRSVRDLRDLTIDVIIDVKFTQDPDRVFICVSDTSVIQFGVNRENLLKTMNEKELLIGSLITSFKNDAENGHFLLEYKPIDHPNVRFLEFNYDPIAQKEYEKSLEK